MTLAWTPGPLLLVVVLLVVVGVCVALVVVTALARTVRRRRGSAHALRLAAVRPLAIAVAAGDEDPGARAALAALTGDDRQAAVDEIVALLTKVRGDGAAELVTVLEDWGELEHARSVLAGSLRLRRARAVRLLGLTRDRRNTELVLGALTDPADEVRLVAVAALGMLGDPRAAGPLLESLRPTGGRDPLPAAAVTEALMGLGTDIAAPLEGGLDDDDPLVRAVAATVAGHGLFGACAPRLAELVAADPEPAVRRAAATALGRVGSDADVKTLVDATTPGHPREVRRVAVSALGELGQAAGQASLEALLVDDDLRLAELAAEALLTFGSRGEAIVVAHAGDDPTTPTPANWVLTRHRLQAAHR